MIKEDNGMNVNGISLSNTGSQGFKTQNQQGNDSYSKNIQNQIANAQKQMQELGENKEMPLEEKMKKRQEIQQQISDLQNQLIPMSVGTSFDFSVP